MLWFKKKAAASLPQPSLPRAWSSEVWEDIFGKGDRFHCSVLISAMKKRQEWEYESRKLHNNTEYYGVLGRGANSLAEHIKVTINFDVSGGSIGTARIRENCIGWVMHSRVESGIQRADPSFGDHSKHARECQ